MRRKCCERFTQSLDGDVQTLLYCQSVNHCDDNRIHRKPLLRTETCPSSIVSSCEAIDVNHEREAGDSARMDPVVMCIHLCHIVAGGEEVIRKPCAYPCQQAQRWPVPRIS